MKTIPTSLPGHLIDWYWDQVEVHLVKSYRVTRASARAGIRKYRTALARCGVGDMVYHADAKDTARGVHDGEYLP